jgi:hypothetical protein
MSERCEKCNRLTEEGKRAEAERSKEHPIYGTDFSKPLSELIQEARNEITRIRGKLSDISFAYSGWGEQIKDVEGTLTSSIIYLYYIKEQMERVEGKK